MRGRKSKYQEHFPELILEYFNVDYETHTEIVASSGKPVEIQKKKIARFPTFEGFAVSIGVAKKTMLSWREKHPEFRNAYEMAKGMQKDILIRGGLLGDFNSSFAKFVAINCTDMVDRTERKSENKHSHDGYEMQWKGGKKIIELGFNLDTHPDDL